MADSTAASATHTDTQQTLLSALPPLIHALQLPDTYTAIDQLQQQNTAIPLDLQQQHQQHTTATTHTLHTLVALLSHTQPQPQPSLPSSLLLDVLVVLMVQCVSMPSSFVRRYPTAVLSYVTPQWLTASNRSLAMQAQRLLCGAGEADEDEAVLSLLYERHAVALIKRLRARMRGKGDEWKDDPSTVYVTLHFLSHLSASSPTSSTVVLEHLHELVPCLLPLLHSHEQRHRIMGCLMLSHVLLLLPSYSFPAFVPLLLHTFAPLLSDRDADTQRIVLPTYVDLVLSSSPAFPLTSAADEAERTAFRLSALSGHFLPELQYLSLSFSAAVDVVCLHLEQLVRLLVWLHVDVLPHVSPLLTALFRFGVSWDAAVRRRAWLSVGVLMDVGGERMAWHKGEVEEQLRLCEVECERQVQVNERVSGWDETDISETAKGESVVAKGARERTEGWRATRQLVIEMRERLYKRWPRKVSVQEQHNAEPEQSDVSLLTSASSSTAAHGVSDLPYVSSLLASLFTVVPLICHYLPLRELLVWSTVNRLVRNNMCPGQSSSAAVAESSAPSGECWRFVPSVHLRWGAGTLGWDRSGPIWLEVNGVKQNLVTVHIQSVLSSVEEPSQRQPTIAEAFTDVSLSAPLYDSSRLDYLPSAPPLPSPPHIPYPLVSPLAAVLRSLRFMRRVELYVDMGSAASSDGSSVDGASLRVLLTVLTLLPSFPLLHHFALRNSFPFALSTEQRDCVVNGLYGCLISLPHLSSVELVGPLPTTRRHPDRRTGWMEDQFAYDAFSELLSKRLVHANMSSRFVADFARHQANIADQIHSLQLQRVAAQQQPVLAGATSSNEKLEGRASFGPAPFRAAAEDYSPHLPQYQSLRSLTLEGDGLTVRRLVHLFPSLVLLESPHLVFPRSATDEPSFPQTSAAEARPDTGDESAGSGTGGHGSSGGGGGCALRFLSTSIILGHLYVLPALSQLDFLQSLYLRVDPRCTGPEPLVSLAALASFTQLRELTLDVNGGHFRHGFYQLSDDEVFDLTWLDQLTRLRYLHIKDYRHTSVATLRSLALLPPTPPSQPASSLPSVPRFVGRVEEFGLDVYLDTIGSRRAGEFVFDAWTHLQRCAVQYTTMTVAASSWDTSRQYISPKCASANAVLRERVGEARWVSEEQLVAGRWDARWKRDMAARL